MTPRRPSNNSNSGLEWHRKLQELDPERADKLLELTQPNGLLHNRFRLRDLLDKGGFGQILTAEDGNLGRLVVIKLLHDISNEKQRRQFNCEATILANLQHPALPSVFDYFTEGDIPFLVMEYIKGDDFGKLLKRKPNFMVQQVLCWADDLLDALDYLHNQSKPIIHRDIKPGNIILTTRGKVILVDFGLAKGEADSMVILSETRKGTSSVFACTRHYAPLEQLNGYGTDAKSDIFALGATLYHLLAGQLPCDAAQRWGQFPKSGRDPLPLAHDLNPAVSIQLSEILLKAMAINPGDRFESAAEMRAELGKVQAEITKVGQEMEEIVRRVEIKSDAHAVDLIDAERNSFEHPTSSTNIQVKDSPIVIQSAEQDKRQQRKETSQPEEEVVKPVMASEDESQLEEDALRAVVEEVVQPAPPDRIEVHIPSIAERRAKSRRLRPIISTLAALLVIATAFAFIIYFRSGTKQNTASKSNYTQGSDNPTLPLGGSISPQANTNQLPENPAPNNTRPNTNGLPGNIRPVDKKQPEVPKPSPIHPQREREEAKEARLHHDIHAQLISPKEIESHHRDAALKRYNRGIAYANSGKYKAAAQEFKAAAILKQNFYEAHILYGNSFVALKDYQAAREQYETAFKSYKKVHKRDFDKATYNLVLVNILMDDKKAVVAHYRKLQTLNRDLARELAENPKVPLKFRDILKTEAPDKRKPQRRPDKRSQQQQRPAQPRKSSRR